MDADPILGYPVGNIFGDKIATVQNDIETGFTVFMIKICGL